MASGFIILADGRCFAPHWPDYDKVVRAVAEELDGDLQKYVLSLLPGPGDEQDVGYGPWFRKSDEHLVERHLDIRDFTLENQHAFHAAVRAAAEKLRPAADSVLKTHLLELADMVDRAERDEPPLSRSHWTSVQPPTGKRVGPGW